MNIDDLTLGDIKKLNSMMSVGENNVKSDLHEEYIGRYVIIRSTNEGINFGILKKADSTGVLISGAIRLYHHKPRDVTQAWYEGVSNSGISDDTKIAPKVESKVIVERYSITPCTEIAAESILSHKCHGQ